MWPPSARDLLAQRRAPGGIDTPWSNLRRAALPRTGPPSCEEVPAADRAGSRQGKAIGDVRRAGRPRDGCSPATRPATSIRSWKRRDREVVDDVVVPVPVARERGGRPHREDEGLERLMRSGLRLHPQLDERLADVTRRSRSDSRCSISRNMRLRCRSTAWRARRGLGASSSRTCSRKGDALARADHLVALIGQLGGEPAHEARGRAGARRAAEMRSRYSLTAVVP